MEPDRSTVVDPVPKGRGNWGDCQQETSTHPSTARGELENGGELGQTAPFPRGICCTILRPDMVLCPKAERAAILVELTVPWEEGIEGAHERKRAKYADLVAECRENG